MLASRILGNAKGLVRAGLVATLLAPALAIAGGPARDPGRGQQLYENHCVKCHSSVVHVRDKHRARSAADVYDWVRHWSRYEKLGWSDDDVADVTAFLAGKYYQFDRAPPATR